jgi:hypothetical protein
MNGKKYAREVFESIQPNLTTPEKLMADPLFGQSATKMFSVSNIQRELESLRIQKPDSPRFNPKIDYINLPK